MHTGISKNLTLYYKLEVPVGNRNCFVLILFALFTVSRIPFVSAQSFVTSERSWWSRRVETWLTDLTAQQELSANKYFHCITFSPSDEVVCIWSWQVCLAPLVTFRGKSRVKSVQNYSVWSGGNIFDPDGCGPFQDDSAPIGLTERLWGTRPALIWPSWSPDRCTTQLYIFL